MFKLPSGSLGEETVTWLEVGTRRVITLFLDSLSRSHKWSRLYIISPWISTINIPGVLTSRQLIRRARDDRTTIYVVTRPPEQVWHREAVEELSESGVANVKLLPELHTKLYYADTAQATFAMFGSANLTQASLGNRELGVLVRSVGGGVAIVRQLFHEAAEIYHQAGGRRIGRQSL